MPVDFEVTGVAQLSASFLTGLLQLLPFDGVTLTGLTSTVVVRSGAIGPDVALSTASPPAPMQS